MEQPIYLDYNATTPVDPAVLEAALPYLRRYWGNPSSNHAYGRRADAAVPAAREQVAGLLGCAPDEIVFTAAGSEGNNLAIKGAAFAGAAKGRHIITTAIEHPAVLKTCRYLAERHGFELTCLPVDSTGRVAVDAVAAALRPDTILITIMHANNEVGTLQPIAEIAALARAKGVLMHTDAAQSVGKVPTRVDELGVDLLTVAGHKLYAPKGVGALYVRRNTTLEPLIHGAGHEGGRRAGTENVPYLVALGKAAALAAATLDEEMPRLGALRDRLFQQLAAGLGDEAQLRQNGHPVHRLPGTLNISFSGIDGEEMLRLTPAVAASTGSACHTGRLEPSAVLTAMGLARAAALGAVRLSLGRYTTVTEIDAAAAALSRAWRQAVQS